jgi:hypothetical protein
MQQSSPWKAGSFSASQEIPHILLKLNVHSCVHKRSALVQILARWIQSYFCKTDFSFVLSLTFWSQYFYWCWELSVVEGVPEIKQCWAHGRHLVWWRLKFSVMWHCTAAQVVPCILKYCSAVIFRVWGSFKMSVTSCLVTQCHCAEDLNLQKHLSENFISPIVHDVCA